MAQIITTNGGGGGGGGGASYTAGCGIDITCGEISIDTSVVAEKSDLSGYQTTSCMVCDLCGADDDHYPSAKAVADAIGGGGGSGDMLKCVYDPNNHSADAFDYCNFTNTPTIPTDNCQLANGCGYITNSALSGYAKTCDIPTDNCQLSNGCGYTTCTGTLTASNISNTAYGSSWSGVTTVAPSKNAVYTKVNSIDALIPSAATCSNQLADKDYVNDSINSVTAYYITKNAQGDQFACYAELAAATTFYSGGVQRTPTRNDYTIVADDECYSDATTRYIYNSGWEYQYTVNETPLTTAQLNALNSGITSAKVSCYDCCMAQCCDIPTDNCQLCNGCGYTTCTGTLSSGDLKTVNCCSLVGSGNIAIQPGITKIFELSSTSDLTTAQAAYERHSGGGYSIIKSGSSYYAPYILTTTYMLFVRIRTWNNPSAPNTRMQMDTINLTISSSSVTTITNYVNQISLATSAPTTGTNTTITLVV